MMRRESLDKLLADYTIEFSELDGDVAGWKFGKDFRPIIMIDSRLVEPTMIKLSKSQFIKYYLDDFYGLCPHEANEANATIMLLRREYDKLKRLYPKYTLSKNDREELEAIVDVEGRLKRLIGHEVGEWSDLDIPLLCAQMIAHEVVISHSPKQYYAWIAKCDRLLEIDY